MKETIVYEKRQKSYGPLDAIAFSDVYKEAPTVLREQSAPLVSIMLLRMTKNPRFPPQQKKKKFFRRYRVRSCLDFMRDSANSLPAQVKDMQSRPLKGPSLPAGVPFSGISLPMLPCIPDSQGFLRCHPARFPHGLREHSLLYRPQYSGSFKTIENVSAT